MSVPEQYAANGGNGSLPSMFAGKRERVQGESTCERLMNSFFGNLSDSLRSSEEREMKRQKQQADCGASKEGVDTFQRCTWQASMPGVFGSNVANFVRERLELTLDELYNGCQKWMQPLYAGVDRENGVRSRGNAVCCGKKAYGVKQLCASGGEDAQDCPASDAFLVHIPAGARDGFRVFVEERYVQEKSGGFGKVYQSRLDLGGNPLPLNEEGKFCVGNGDIFGSPRRTSSMSSKCNGAYFGCGEGSSEERDKNGGRRSPVLTNGDDERGGAGSSLVYDEKGFVGGGDYNSTIQSMRGNVYVFEVVEKKHPFYSRKNCDLYRTVKITLEQALTGFDLNIDLFGRKKLSLCFRDVIQPSEVRKIKGEGMPRHAVMYGERVNSNCDDADGEAGGSRDAPSSHALRRPSEGDRGDLYLSFVITFPPKLTNGQKKSLREVFQSPPSPHV
mmetsp:Transcript_30743/g.80407  ORF Transcript_30743/g.80407 Transcript_30743/m.80407 type:complete len:446 (+) Transcript_30743:271-1608(+)|eukprot:CAMPEP_0113874494 /NCGR_PEP_ID=MMETSP0780_2-20120614/4366_1 /TAXON_ID=652834 /ORGANISM="Palpitomonas bilix" /LENGTH=445 /DNA_ID=CAMNT_0000860275 /DNA_START=256 /DNA_END=1593 /DNA_ORIENTATION=- /assembly_acc=CAM_ASM_000599